MKIFYSLAIPAVLLVLFLVALLFGGPGNATDVTAIHRLASLRGESPGLTDFAIALTWAGSAYATIGLAVITALWLLLIGERKRALLLVIGIAGERLLADGLKYLIDRPRPAFDIHAVPVNSAAFPSGHAANSMGAFVMIALIAMPPRYRAHAVAAAVLLSLAVGATRPFLGVHWPSDVIGGWSLGLLAAWIALKIGERSGYLPIEPQHQVVGRHGAAIDKG